MRHGHLFPALSTAALAALLAGIGCAPAEEGDLAADDLGTAVDAAVDYVEGEIGGATASAARATPPERGTVAGLTTAAPAVPLAEDEGVGSLRERIRDQVIAAALEEPCALKGLLAGIYDPRDESGGTFGGVGFRRDGELVGTTTGTWTPGESGGGSFAGGWDKALDDTEGSMGGHYGPAEGDLLGTFEGAWAFADSAEGIEDGHIGGIWHPWGERGFFIGYWARCEG